MSAQIRFLGGAGTVTGSKYLVEAHGKKILIDCGLFQGLKKLRLKNWDEFAINPETIDCIILTHAHIDHSGYIPRLIKSGFRGKVYSTEATRDVCKILLPDCGYLLEEEAVYLNRVQRTKHKPALPLFTSEDAEEALESFVNVPFHKTHAISSQISFEFRYAGHILGASSVVLTVDHKKIFFTGDVGRINDEIFHPPDVIPNMDYLVTESTYGNRLHSSEDVATELSHVVNETYGRGGVLVIPAFAVGRAQSIMYYLTQLRRQNRIPSMPMFLNSPMATDFSSIFKKHTKLHKLTLKDCAEIDSHFRYVRSADESRALNERTGPMIIISASGMLTGGRVLHHLKAFAPHPENTILLSGYQSAGTRGESLQNGAREVKIHGEYIPVRAQVRNLDNISAHADYGELIQWFQHSKVKPKKVFITHGEASAADEFRRRLAEKFGWDCSVPEQDEIFKLE
ncbi:MAG: mRNA 3'-end processing factor [Bdellovibrionales bacterium RIFCSPHIGHO2_01_FULL_40_29]|nr:MAG: mRNA 3'-end processing factor [Bdellovibrionales bacterium RIFCSPHIGHO2_01_FULL_40_29]OFZ32561.1 MAG: mRNA 3'-end processing factor [Bdellovibrionales bacterium RIFCSPHIGHO2_02_FULL_40_15]